MLADLERFRIPEELQAALAEIDARQKKQLEALLAEFATTQAAGKKGPDLRRLRPEEKIITKLILDKNENINDKTPVEESTRKDKPTYQPPGLLKPNERPVTPKRRYLFVGGEAIELPLRPGELKKLLASLSSSTLDGIRLVQL